MILLYEVDGGSSIVNYQIYIKTGMRNTPNEKSTCISQMLFTISIIPPRTKSTNKRQIREMRIEI